MLRGYPTCLVVRRIIRTIMRYLWVILASLALTLAITSLRQEPAALQIDNIRISKNEFWEAFHLSRSSLGDPSDPKAFLEQYITKKVVLREAERRGLDKDPQLLAGMQQYWEQELFKRMITAKNKELEGGVSVSEEDILRYYEHHRDVFFVSKTLEEVRPQIQEFLVQEKQREEILRWLEGLKMKTQIIVDSQALGI